MICSGDGTCRYAKLLPSPYYNMANILKELAQFAERQAERRCIDKQIFVWAVICFCDFIRKKGYKLVYIGKNHGKQSIREIPKRTADAKQE